jgi:hypothetical protein
VQRVVAIDWSGARTGAETRIWLADIDRDRFVRLECGRGREDIIQHLVYAAMGDPHLVVGLDFAFGFPFWFADDLGADCASEVWNLAARHGESWLRECPHPFWGRPGCKRPPAEILREPLRQTDREARPVGTIRPKSVFQIGGAGAVGTGSIRGMPFLSRLAEHGFSIWPFDEPRLPMVVEIYPRLLTGAVVKSEPGARGRYLRDRYPDLHRFISEKAASSEDAFDAAVSALVLWEHREELLNLKRSADAQVRLEGWIWAPGVET